MPHRIRSLFVLICLHNTPLLPTAIDLWNEFKNSMSEDFIRIGKNTQDAFNMALQVINFNKILIYFKIKFKNKNKIFFQFSKHINYLIQLNTNNESNCNTFKLPIPVGEYQPLTQTILDVTDYKKIFDELFKKCTLEQKVFTLDIKLKKN